MADRVWKGVYLYIFGCSHQLLLNKFFDLSTPSMRKGCDGENTSLAAKGALANHLQRRNACKIQNVRTCQLSLNKFFDLSTPSMRKGCDGENMDVQWGYMLFRGVICCSGGLYAVQEGYMDVQESCILFRWVICCITIVIFVHRFLR